MTNQQDLPLLILIDGHSLAFRAYYAFFNSRKGLLKTSTGIPTSICFGFLNSLMQVIKLEKPKYIGIAFDSKEKTFRHKFDTEYKANRPETPEDFIIDIKNLQKILEILDIVTITMPGYEADDILGTLAVEASNRGYRVKVLSGDKDLFQLIDDKKNISILYLEGNRIKSSSERKYTEITSTTVIERLGITSDQVIDYKALCGDKSDNIPGVKGIGEKTAVKLLTQYKTLEGIYHNIEYIKGANQKKLKEGKKEADRSRYLAKIIINCPLVFNIDEFELKGFDQSAAQNLFEKLELKTFNENINQLQEKLGGKFSQKLLKKTDQLINKDQVLNHSNNPKTNSKEICIRPQIISNTLQLDKLVNILLSYQNNNFPVAWDIETTDLNPQKAELIGIGCCWGEEVNDIAYIPIGHKEGKQLSRKEILEKLRPILESNIYPKVFQNTKFDRLVLENQGINLDGVVFDTMLASYVINPDNSHKLSSLCKQYLNNIVSKDYSELGINKKQTIADLDILQVADYCGMDAYSTFLLVKPLKEKLKKFPSLEQLFSKVEQSLEIVLSKMESQGILIDIDYLKNLSKEIKSNLFSLEEKIYEEAEEKFNLGSPKQLSKILFEKLQLSTKKSKKIITGYSTDHATLEKLKGDHSIIDHLLEYRTLSKLQSTYIDTLPILVDRKTCRIHTSFNQSITATGRLSSSNPNLQNIPIRTELSRKIRKAFIPPKEWLLVSADYSQIELRILAYLSQEPLLVNAYCNYQDIHTVTAQLLFDKKEITTEERNLGKTINFGVIYGMGSQRFAREAGVTIAKGKDFIKKYHERYTKVFEFLENVKIEAITKGYVTTILGRRRYFNFYSDSLRNLYGCDSSKINLEELKYSYKDSQLLRAAANAPIQGSSADIIKVAMIKIEKLLKNYQAKLLLQVHDELVFEIPLEELEELKNKIKQIMEKSVDLTIPLLVEVKSGVNWMEAK